MLCIGIGVLLMTLVESTGIRLVGLGLWWLGALLIVDSWLGDGLPAQLLWGVWAMAAVGAYLYTDIPRWAVEGDGRPAVALGTLALAAATFFRRNRPAPRSEPPLGELLSELRDKVDHASRPTRPADPSAEVSRLLTILDNLAEEVRTERPHDGAELASALNRYRSNHGDQTVATSPHPERLRAAVLTLVRETETVRRRVPPTSPAFPPLVLLVGYAREVSDLVLDNTR